MKAAQNHISGNDSLKSKKILIQGVGNVGQKVVNYLIKEDSNIYVTDINKNNLEIVSNKNVKVLKPDEIFDRSYDIISPCALGGVINLKNLNKIDCNIIAGAANNQLSDDNYVPQKLKKKNILYVPDFLINAGGIISVYHEQINDLDVKKVMNMTESIYQKVGKVLSYADVNSLSTHQAAINLAQQRIIENSKK